MERVWVKKVLNPTLNNNEYWVTPTGRPDVQMAISEEGGVFKVSVVLKKYDIFYKRDWYNSLVPIRTLEDAKTIAEKEISLVEFFVDTGKMMASLLDRPDDAASKLSTGYTLNPVNYQTGATGPSTGCVADGPIFTKRFGE